jgi:hypothetical protein
MEVPVKPRRPPSLPLVCVVFPDHSSFSVFRGTPMAFTRYHFKRLKCYQKVKLLQAIKDSFCLLHLSFGDLDLFRASDLLPATLLCDLGGDMGCRFRRAPCAMHRGPRLYR